MFEWVTDRLGAQGTVCAGGRYDGLVEQLGGRPTPAVGFAMGLERLVALLQAARRCAARSGAARLPGSGGRGRRNEQGMVLAEQLRDALPAMRLLLNCGGGSFKSQFKRADSSGARYALMLGDDEVQRRVIGIKPLRGGTSQRRRWHLTALHRRLGAMTAGYGLSTVS